MKGITQFSVLLLMFCIGCVSIPKGYEKVNGTVPSRIDVNEQCSSIFKLLSNKWLKNKTFKCYYVGENVVELLEENTTCFNDWEVKEVVNLLGEPNIKDKIMSYNISNDCTDRLGDRKYTLYFYYEDEEAKFENRIISGSSIEKILKN